MEEKIILAKTVAETFSEIISEICDGYCRWPLERKDEEELFEHCVKCPLDRLGA